MIFWFGIVLLVIIPIVLFNRGRTRESDNPVEDPDELAAAEREVRDLDAFTKPDDAQRDLPDWGPGVPH